MNRFEQKSVEQMTTTQLHQANASLKTDIKRLTPMYRQARQQLAELNEQLGIRISRQQDVSREIYRREGKVTRVSSDGKVTYTLKEQVARMTPERKQELLRLLEKEVA